MALSVSDGMCRLVMASSVSDGSDGTRRLVMAVSGSDGMAVSVSDGRRLVVG